MVTGVGVTGFRVDLDALVALLERLQAFDRRAMTVEADLEQEASRLDAQWVGAAAERHDAAHRQWVRAHDELRRAANELAGFVRGAHTNYTDAADANVRMWRDA